MAAEVQIEHIYDGAQPPEALLADVEACVAETLMQEGFAYSVWLELDWVDNAGIRAVNRDIRRKDAVTDVLSIPFLETGPDGKPVVGPGDLFEGWVQLGEIVLSLERAREQADQFGHSLRREVCFLAVHSMLHLLGYDHELGQAEESEMFTKQESVLEKLGIRR